MGLEGNGLKENFKRGSIEQLGEQPDCLFILKGHSLLKQVSLNSVVKLQCNLLPEGSTFSDQSVRKQCTLRFLPAPFLPLC